MRLQFYGAADGVTGSLHRIQTNQADILLDCGLFQGHRAEANLRNRHLPDWAQFAHALVLSHAHLDHSGNIPSLVKKGFTGNIYCTPPTRDLCSVMFRDAAMIQEQDARYLNKRYAREGKSERIEALYTVEDAQAAMKSMIGVPLHRKMTIAPGVSLTFFDAGHVLGSALVCLDLHEAGRSCRLLYTGDLGREELPLLQSPEIVEGIDFLLMESTYGDRSHPDVSSIDEQLGKIVNSTIQRGGRVMIPTFALERAQEVLFALERLHERKLVPRVPIYIDSPLAIAITEIYKLHPEGLSADVQQRLLQRNDPFSPPGLQYISDVQDSRHLQDRDEPCVIIAGSGMCEGGRILHHFVGGLENPLNSVIIVGFMAQHTLGRRLIERRNKVRVFGLERNVFAQIHSLGGLSAHADREDLLRFARQIANKGYVRRVGLVHGEIGPRASLAKALLGNGFPQVIEAEPGAVVEL